MTIVSVKELTKRFERKKEEPFTAVDRISFSINAGERVAFIGPNGAGKSTTLKMLTGLLYPTDGHAEVAGYIPWKQRKKLAYEIGIVFGQRSQLWYHLPVRDSFDLLSKIYDIPAAVYRERLAHVIEVLQIGALVDQPVKSLSLGQRMRCEIAASLLHRPKVLFLDEPTIGLDVTAKALLREHLQDLARTENTTIMLTSHDTGDIEAICDRVILINHGRILLDKPIAALKADFLSQKIITLVTDDEQPDIALEGAVVVARDRHQITLSVNQTQHAVDKIVAEALKTLKVRDLSIENAPLESIIRDLYGEKV
ncbi:MAG: ATP-binding cassette domain-containing protein [Pseudomonadota bacterium]|nr:ATP-binding cassette domain-containing protein [Pseudomonadota bacterium]